MARTATTTAAVATRATAATARAAAVAKPATPRATVARTATPVIATIGTDAEPCGAHYIGTQAAALDFARTVLASIVSLDTGLDADCWQVEAVAPGAYLATYGTAAGPVVVAFGTAEPAAPAAAPVATPARPAKPAPTAAQAVALKAASGVARAAIVTPAAPAPVVRVYIKHHGAFDVPAAVIEGKGADFVRTHIAPRVQAALGWPSASVETCTQVAKGIYVAGIMSGRNKVEASFGPLDANVGPIVPARALPAAPLDKLAQMARAAGIAPSAPAPVSVRARREAAVIAGATPRAPEAPRYGAAHLATLAEAAKGKMPTPPDFTAETHRRYRPKLAELVALAKAGNIAGLEAYHINPCSTSPKAMAKYRDAAVIALKAKAAKKAGA